MQHYGRIFKSLHILQLIDDEAYRRDIKWIRNLQEGRHSFARKATATAAAVSALPRRNGGSARRARTRDQLHRPLEHRLHQRALPAPRGRYPSGRRTSSAFTRSDGATCACAATTRSRSRARRPAAGAPRPHREPGPRGRRRGPSCVACQQRTTATAGQARAQRSAAPRRPERARDRGATWLSRPLTERHAVVCHAVTNGGSARSMDGPRFVCDQVSAPDRRAPCWWRDSRLLAGPRSSPALRIPQVRRAARLGAKRAATRADPDPGLRAARFV